jgi:hypothetical protein
VPFSAADSTRSTSKRHARGPRSATPPASVHTRAYHVCDRAEEAREHSEIGTYLETLADVLTSIAATLETDVPEWFETDGPPDELLVKVSRRGRWRPDRAASRRRAPRSARCACR